MKLSEKTLRIIAWGLSALVSVLAIYVWGHSFAWHFSRLGAYRLFPLLGLLAFSLMWVHFVMGLLKSLFNPAADLKKYYRYTSRAVLFLILLHPGLLLYQLWRDGYGLPPGSYKFYVSASMTSFVLLGMAALFAFLLYECKPWFEKQKFWPWAEQINNLAMLMIVVHSLKLGQNVQRGWYHDVWLFYAVVLFICLGYSYYTKFSQHPHRS